MGIPKGGIAFFDSGIGGLTVLHECKKALPFETFYYYGDNKRAPYGNLPTKKIKKYVAQAFKRFQRLQVKAVVLACNTVTAVCVEELRVKYSFPIIGAEPAVLLGAKRGGETFVLTTRATHESKRFHVLLEKASTLYPKTKISAFPCEGLAGEIEKNILKKEKDYTLFLPRGKPDAVVLGCTHYVYIAEQIQRFYGCQIFDGNCGIALRLCQVLEEEKTQKTQLDPFRPPNAKKASFLPLSKHKKAGREQGKAKNGKGTKKGEWSKRTILDSGQGRIYFLGSGKRRCKRINKQTFA